MKPWQVILIFLGMVAIFMGGYHFRGFTQKVEVRSDTLIYIDTIRDSIPYPIMETEIELIPEPFPEYITLAGETIHDTIYVNLPHIQKEYRTKDYHLFVSGYKPNLDSIEVYRTTENITRTIKQKRFGIGVIGGYGIGKNGLSPYVGIGGFYRIW